MKAPMLLIFLWSFTLASCEDESNRAHTPPTKSVLGVIVTVERSSPPGMDTFHESLDNALANWREVEHRDFYYESPDFAQTDFPWQEGRLQDPNSGKSGKWRYYHCSGLRIQWDNESVKYYLPPPSVEDTSKNAEAEQDAPSNGG